MGDRILRSRNGADADADERRPQYAPSTATSACPPPTPIPTPPHSHSASTPIAKRGFSTGSEGSLSRAKNLHDSLRARHVVWLEQLHHDGQPMLDEFLGRMDARYHDFAETISQIAEVRTFVRTAGLGAVNEDEFSAMIGAVFRRLVVAEELEFEGGDGVRYVRSGSNGMHARMHGHPWVEDGGVPRDRRFALKPDFFTARVLRVAGEWAPVSLSTMMHGYLDLHSVEGQGDGGENCQQQQVRRSERIATRTGTCGASSLPTLPPPVLTNTSNRFTWDDPHVLWEVKSSADTLNATPVLSNLILKATETLRFQWQRHFVLVFLVCGTNLRMLRCERSCVLVGASVDFGGDAGVLVKCLIAGFVVGGGADVGLLVDDRTVEMVDVDGKPRVVVEVGGQEFILGEQIIGPQRDHLVGRATTVHLARRRTGDTDWKYCFKCAWPYAARPHEGVVLQSLQDNPGVVRLLAWDALSVPGTLSLTPERIARDFRLQSVDTSGRATPAVETLSLSASSSVSREKMPVGGEDMDASDEGDVRGGTAQQFQFHPREFRRTVTVYIKDSFATTTHLTTLELLQTWRSLYLVTNSIASKGWVHRDLSWTNVRLHHSPSSTWSPTLIDFDLASPIDGPTSGTPDKTGTPTFMSVEILASSNDFPVRHQELHEDEVVFWIGFFAIISRVPSGLAAVEKLQDPALSMEQLGSSKTAMLLGHVARRRWDRWFGEMEGREGTVLKALCRRIVEILFLSREGFPGAEEVDGVGARMHLAVHESVVAEIVGELERAMEELRLRGTGQVVESGVSEEKERENDDGTRTLVSLAESSLELS